MINDDNIELYLFRLKEGLLDATETAAVERALASHPQWQALADSYDPDLTLPAGATVPYPHAASLRNGGPKAARRRVIPVWIASAVAACVIFAVAVGFLNRIQTTPQGNPVVVAAQPAMPADTLDVPTETTSPQRATSLPMTQSNTVVYDGIAPTVETAIEQKQPSSQEMLLPSALAGAEEPVMLADNSGLQTPSHEADEESQEAIYSNKLITYIDDFSEQAALRTPPIYLTGQSQGDARSAISEQVSELASKSGSFIANTRRRYQEHESQLVSDIEDITENNPIIRRLIASIL